MISDGQARRIAAEWHGGQKSMLCSFATSGFIGEDTEVEIVREMEYLTDREKPFNTSVMFDLADLSALLLYVHSSGPRPRQDGWSALWDETPVMDPARVPSGCHVAGCCETCGRFDDAHDREDCFK